MILINYNDIWDDSIHCKDENLKFSKSENLAKGKINTCYS